MKGFFSIGMFVVIIALGVLFGGIALTLGRDVAFAISCLGCAESQQVLLNDVGIIFSSGQERTNAGVDNLLKLQDEEYKSKFSDDELNRQISSSKDDILKGSGATLILIVFFLLIFNVIGKIIFGGSYPFLYALIISVIIVGVVGVIASGGTTGFYEGSIKLIMNWNVLGTDIVPNLGNDLMNASINNMTGGLI